jgi:PEP-CTERM motif
MVENSGFAGKIHWMEKSETKQSFVERGEQIMTPKTQLCAILVAVIIAFVMQNPVYAITVSQIDGNQIDSSSALNFALVSPSNTDPTKASLTLSGGLSTKFIDPNGVDVTPSGLGGAPFATFISPFSLSRTGTVVFAFTPFPEPPFALMQFDVMVDSQPSTPGKSINGPGGGVNFDLSDVKALVPFTFDSPRPCPGGCNELIIQGKENVHVDATNLGIITQFFRINIFGSTDFTGGFVNFLDIIENGGERSSADDPVAARLDTFVQSSDPAIFVPITVPVPEPSSISLILFGLAGLWFTRRISGSRQTPPV